MLLRSLPLPLSRTGCLARELPLATSHVKDYVDLVEHEGLTLLTN